MRVLVADDDDVALSLVSRVFSQAGASVEQVRDGRGVLRAISRKRYDLVVLDYRMPGMDADALLSSPQAQSISDRVIVITGDVLNPRAIAFLRESGLPHVIKPTGVPALRRAVLQVLRKTLDR